MSAWCGWSWGRWFGGMVALACILAGLGGCVSAGGANSETPVLSYEASQATGLRSRWLRQLGLVEGERIAHAWRVGDGLYVMTDHGYLHSVSASKGTINWVCDLGRETRDIYRPAETDAGHLIIMSGTVVFMLDMKKGDILHRVPLDFAAGSAPVVVGNHIAVGGGAEFFHGLWLDLLGKRQWSVRSPKDSFESNPVLVQGHDVIFASKHGYLWMVTAEDGNAIWMNRKTEGDIVAPLASDGRLLYVPALDGRLHVFEVSSGNALWDARVEGRAEFPATPAGAVVLLPTKGKGLYAFTTDKGEQKWFVPGVAQVAARSTTTAFAVGGGSLLLINLDTGAIEKSVALPHVARYVYNTQDATVFVVTTDGRVAAIEQTK